MAATYSATTAKRPSATTLRATAARSSVSAKRTPKSQPTAAKSSQSRTMGQKNPREVCCARYSLFRESFS